MGVSEWDGYRDTVEDGVVGLRVPTVLPEEGFGADLALRQSLGIDTYDRYCGQTCSLVAVDIEMTALAFERLFLSRELRQKMGEAGRESVSKNYDWSVLIPRYEALWESLKEKRAEAKVQPLPHPHPARLDPFYGFASYPTRALKPSMSLVLAGTPNAAKERLLRFRDLRMVYYSQVVFPTDHEIATILPASSAMHTVSQFL